MIKKVIVVTGASSGIGKEIYDQYAADDAYVVYGISRRGPDIKMDLSNFVELSRFQTNVKPELLINCAGIMPLVDETEQVMNVNFWAPYYLTEIFMNPLLNVINIASVSAHKPDPHQPIYAASKAALIAMTKSYAKRYADGGQRFNSISPGFVESELVPGDTPMNLIDEVPMGFEADPFDVYKAVKFIEECGYLTGADIIVDGGLSC